VGKQDTSDVDDPGRSHPPSLLASHNYYLRSSPDDIRHVNFHLIAFDDTITRPRLQSKTRSFILCILYDGHASFQNALPGPHGPELLQPLLLLYPNNLDYYYHTIHSEATCPHGG